MKTLTIEERAEQIVADELANGCITQQQAESSRADWVRWLRTRSESPFRREYGISSCDENR